MLRDLTPEEFYALPPLPALSFIHWLIPWGPPDSFKGPYTHGPYDIPAYEKWLLRVAENPRSALNSFWDELDEARVHWPDCDKVWFTVVKFERSKPPGGSSPPPSSPQLILPRTASIIKFIDMRATNDGEDGRYRQDQWAA